MGVDPRLRTNRSEQRARAQRTRFNTSTLQPVTKGTRLLPSFDALLGRCGEKKNDPYISDWSAVRSNHNGRCHVCIRNSGQQYLLANGDLETRWRGLDLR